MTVRRTLTPVLFVLTLLLTTAALALGLATSASAHSELVSSMPEDGDTLDEAPSEIVLEFNEDIQDLGNEIVVVDSEGTPVADGEPEVDGPTVMQAVTGGAAGTFTVTWRVVSADGHPISGELSYDVSAPEPTTETSTAEPTTTETTTTEATTADATSEAPSSATASADAADQDSGGDSAVLWIVLAAVAAAVVAIVLIMRRNRAS